MFGITSFYFLCFYALILLIYYIMPQKTRWMILLLANSTFYYLSAGIKGMLILLYGIIVAYLGTRWIVYEKIQKKKKWACIITAVLLLGILIISKYINFFVYTGNIASGLFNIHLGIKTIKFIMPIGFTFYTFILLGYVIDVYRETSPIERNIIKFSLFATYFPQMISGPFVRFQEMKDQLVEGHAFDYQRITHGFQRIAWGFFKKLVIAERMAAIVNSVYGDYSAYSGIYIIFATVCFALQLYTDFSGAMDIVLGVSESFGIILPENFQTPFFSKNISEYWRRWHITLGAWFRDYIFYPTLKSDWIQNLGQICKKKLGKKKGKKIPTYLAMLILWFLVGFWHGGSWNYIIGSGLLHWFYIVFGELLEPTFKKIIQVLRIRTECFSWRLFQQFRTFSLVCIGFVFFRSDGTVHAVQIIKYTVTNLYSKGITLNLGLDIFDAAVGVIAVFVLFMISLLQEHLGGHYVRKKMDEQNLIFRWICWYALIFSVIIFGFYGPGYNASEFIYQGF